MIEEPVSPHSLPVTQAADDSATVTVAAQVRPAAVTRARIVWLALALILLLGGYLRFSGLNWDQFTHLHPDERFLTLVAAKLHSVESPLDYFRTSTSSLNPYNVGEPFYVYGNLPLTVTRYAAEFAAGICPPARCELYGRPVDLTGFDGIHFVGRFLAAALDMLTIGFVFLIGRRLYDERVGLLGALLLALAVLPIQQSHFFTTDNWAAAFCTVAVYCAVRVAETNRQRWQAAFGVFLGLAVASRINVAPLAALSALAALLWYSRQIAVWRDVWTPRSADLLTRAASGVLLAALVSVAVFRVAMPYAFADHRMARELTRAEREQQSGLPVALDEVSLTDPRVLLRSVVGFNPDWLGDMGEIQRLQQPDASFPPALQWTARTPIVMPFTNIFFYGLGIPATLAALLGLGWAFWQMTRERPGWRAHVLLWVWTVAYFLFMGTRWVKSMRYFLPIYPTLVLIAAWALVALWQRAGADRRRQVVAGAAMALVVVPTLLWAVAFSNIYRRDLTRVAATNWFYDNIPSAATLLYTVDGAPRELHLPLKNHLFQVGGTPVAFSFEMPEAGVVTGVRLNYLTSEQLIAEPPRMAVMLDAVGTSVAGEALLDLPAPRSAATIPLPPTLLPADQPIFLRANMTAGGIVIANTAVIANEHWDDALPTRGFGRDPFGQYYSGLFDDLSGTDGQIPIPNIDSEDKRAAFQRWLNASDVIVLSSQRALWSTPRLPAMFPLTTRYYEALFNGELGFELAAQFHADIHIGPLYISDTGGKIAWGRPPQIGWPPPSDLTAAEEAFSVYDHPPVWVFVKQPDYDPQRVADVLNAVDLSRVTFMNPGQATAVPNALRLDAATMAAREAAGSFSALFNPDGLLNRQPLLAAVAWYGLALLLGWLAFPLAFTLFAGLPTRGYALARVLGLLLVAYFGWLSASLQLLPNRDGTYWLGTALLAVAAGALLIRRRAALLDYVRQNGRLLLLLEGIGLALFIGGLLLRLGNPDVWHVIWGGEKPMDLTYLTAVLKSNAFPPYDPWYAGGVLNYYYFGFVYIGALVHMLGIVPAIAYNLAIALLFSFTGLAAFGITYDLLAWSKLASGRSIVRRAALGGGVTLALTVLLGNLAQWNVLVNAASAASNPALGDVPLVGGVLRTLSGLGSLIVNGLLSAPIYPSDWFWNASRAITVPEGEVGPITEFPFFTFLYGDLHAHMIALPLTLLALTWALAYGLRSLPDAAGRRHWALLGVGALAIGVLYPTNSWDWPTYLVVGVLGIVLANLRAVGRLNLLLLGKVIVEAALLGALSYVLFLPFHQNFGAGFSEIARWQGAPTGLASYLRVYGLFLLLVLAYLAYETRTVLAGLSVELLAALERWRWAVALAVGLALLVTAALTLLATPVALVALPIILLAGGLALPPVLPTSRRIVLALIASAFFLTLFVDLFVIEGTVGRMNTVFKFYMQVWTMLSVAGGFALATLWPRSRQWGVVRQTAFRTALLALLVVAALYAPLAVTARWADRMSADAPRTLDGMAFMPTASYQENGQNVSLAPDYAALRWMQRNIPGSPVVAEAYSHNYYRSIGNRVAMYTGLPTIIGWAGHQSQQRAAVPDAQIQQRVADVELLYTVPDVQMAGAIIERYGVDYIYVGTLERLYYLDSGLAKFDTMAAAGQLETVYEAAGVTIYRVVAAAETATSGANG